MGTIAFVATIKMTEANTLGRICITDNRMRNWLLFPKPAILIQENPELKAWKRMLDKYKASGIYAFEKSECEILKKQFPEYNIASMQEVLEKLLGRRVSYEEACHLIGDKTTTIADLSTKLTRLGKMYMLGTQLKQDKIRGENNELR